MTPGDSKLLEGSHDLHYTTNTDDFKLLECQTNTSGSSALKGFEMKKKKSGVYVRLRLLKTCSRKSGEGTQKLRLSIIQTTSLLELGSYTV